MFLLGVLVGGLGTAVLATLKPGLFAAVKNWVAKVFKLKTTE